MSGEDADAAAPTSLVDLIDGLAEPPEPAPIPLTPETWGWAALALLVAAVIALALWRSIVRRRANAYRRAALSELDRARTAAEVAAILRRAALAAWPREQVAGLTGADWTGFLARTGRGGFPEEAAAELRAAPWRDETAPPSENLRRAAGDWLHSHRASAPADAARPVRRAAACCRSLLPGRFSCSPCRSLSGASCRRIGSGRKRSASRSFVA